jgi:hypothetical protein
MPQASNWRSPEAYAYLNELTPADLAWEFLRRNPEYIRDYRACSSSRAVKPPLPKRLPVAGVCHFLLDPGVGADRASVVWLPQLDPSAVLLAPAPPHFDARSMSTIVPEFQRRASDGEYWLIGRGPARIAVVLIGRQGDRAGLRDCPARCRISQAHGRNAPPLAVPERRVTAAPARSSYSARARATAPQTPCPWTPDSQGRLIGRSRRYCLLQAVPLTVEAGMATTSGLALSVWSRMPRD